MSIQIDARGRSCPEPVIMTKKAIEENISEKIEVHVDSPVAVENITRFSKGLGYGVIVKERDDEFTIELSK